MLKKLLSIVAIVLLLSGIAVAEGKKNPVVLMETTQGDIKIELFEKEAPITVKNFLEYASSGFYAGTIFHRIVPASPQSRIVVIQGGGLTKDLNPKQTRAPIKNEAGNGLKNDRGTLSMARSGNPDSATSQFFINVKDNNFLDRPSPDGFGYAVFGKIVGGLDIMDKIVAVPQERKNAVFENVPVVPVIIKSVKLL
jgi:peptidyl-prolyl cis-trans isomerase A (cyclophilin A)